MENVAPLDLSETPIWRYVSIYYDMFTCVSEEQAQEWLNSEYVPKQLKEQVKELGDKLIELGIEP